MSVSNEEIGDYAVKFAIRYGWVTADVLHELDYGMRDKRIIGLVLARLARKGVLKPMMHIKSKRPKCHHRPIVLYHINRYYGA